MSFQDKLNSVFAKTLEGYRTELEVVLNHSIEKEISDKEVVQEKNDEKMKQETDFEK